MASLPKHPRLRLDPGPYDELRRQALTRDGWRCQICGSRQNLQVHHRKSRAQSGDDTEPNLMTICSDCHSRIHLGR